MIVEQPILRRLLADAAVARGLAAADVPELDAARTAVGEGSDAAALVVLSGFGLPEFARGTAEFVARLDDATRADWYRDFTRTRFLVGRPDRIAARFGPLLTFRTRDIAWVSPGTPAKERLTLRRLLKPLRTAGRSSLDQEQVPLSGIPQPAIASRTAKRVVLATDGLPLEQYLVTLNHTLCEGIISETLTPRDMIVVREVKTIERLPSRFDYVRIVADPQGENRLKAMSYISPGEARSGHRA
jgi:hypothetical protein